MRSILKHCVSCLFPIVLRYAISIFWVPSTAHLITNRNGNQGRVRDRPGPQVIKQMRRRQFKA